MISQLKGMIKKLSASFCTHNCHGLKNIVLNLSHRNYTTPQRDCQNGYMIAGQSITDQQDAFLAKGDN